MSHSPLLTLPSTEEYFNNPLFSDVTIFVNPSLPTKEFLELNDLQARQSHCQAVYYSHRFLLATRAEYFKLLFTTEMSERDHWKEVLLYEIDDPIAFNLYMKLLYSFNSNELFSTAENSQQLPDLSYQFNLIFKLLEFSEQFQSSWLQKVLEFCIILTCIDILENFEGSWSDFIGSIRSRCEELNLAATLEFLNSPLSFLQRHILFNVT